MLCIILSATSNFHGSATFYLSILECFAAILVKCKIRCQSHECRHYLYFCLLDCGIFIIVTNLCHLIVGKRCLFVHALCPLFVSISTTILFTVHLWWFILITPIYRNFKFVHVTLLMVFQYISLVSSNQENQEIDRNIVLRWEKWGYLSWPDIHMMR